MISRPQIHPQTDMPLMPVERRKSKILSVKNLQKSILSLDLALILLGVCGVLLQTPLMVLGGILWLLVMILVFPNQVKKQTRLQALSVVSAAVLLSYTPSVFAQTTGGTSCQAGIFSRIASVFVNAYNSVGLASLATDVCNLNTIATGIVAILLIGFVVYGAIQTHRENDLKAAWFPLGLVFVVLVSIGMISKAVFQTVI